MVEVETIVRDTIEEFCFEFLDSPYLCYTEHGLHALFFNRLYKNLPAESRYSIWNGQKVCIIQKEYPTADRLGKGRRQNWDIAILETPLQSIKEPSYDYFKLNSVVEFGLNESKDHLEDDIARLSHPKANLKLGFIVHLYRVSEEISGHDWTSRQKRFTDEKEIADLLKGKKGLTAYFALVDAENHIRNGPWKIGADSGFEPMKR